MFRALFLLNSTCYPPANTQAFQNGYLFIAGALATIVTHQATGKAHEENHKIITTTKTNFKYFLNILSKKILRLGDNARNSAI